MRDRKDITRLDRRLGTLNQAVARAKGTLWRPFFCPILMTNEPAELCKGHVVSRSVGGRDWVVQRKDVDNFFGHFVESDLAHLVTLHELDEADEALGYLHRHRLMGGRVPVTVETNRQVTQNPSLQDESNVGRLFFDMDRLLLGAQIACIHTVHLGLFKTVKYGYVFDRAGEFPAALLRNLFTAFAGEQGKAARREVRRDPERLRAMFSPYGNLVRPAGGARDHLDPRLLENPFHWFQVAWNGERPFATIHYIQAKGQCHAVMAYSSFHGESIAVSVSEAPISFSVSLGHWQGNVVEVAPTRIDAVWPCGSIRDVPPTPIGVAAKIMEDRWGRR